MQIVLAADHNGIALKARLVDELVAAGHAIDDRGSHGEEVVDYPLLCHDLASRVADGRADRGIVVGGTGSGETMALNKVPGVRATLCERGMTARIARENNDGNVLVLGAKVVGPDLASRLVEIWLMAEFTGGKHQRRLDQIAAIERGERPTA